MKKNLVLSLPPDEGEDYHNDFEVIASRVHELAPDVDVHLLFDDSVPESLIEATRKHPTLITAIYERDLSALQGRLMACHPMTKTEQYLRYATAGLPFPPSTVFRWGMKLDPAQFSDFVVMKPINPARSSHGALHLLPTSLIPEIRPQHFPKDHPIHTETMLLQRFVDTGRYPKHGRVLFLFGEPLYQMETTLKDPRPLLSASRQELFRANIATNGGPRDRILVDDPEIMQLARKALKALPDVPLQGIDVVRERKTGRLFVLESNPGGNTWHFSAKLTVPMRAEMGDGRNKLLKQFNALEAASRALAAATLTHARSSR